MRWAWRAASEGSRAARRLGQPTGNGPLSDQLDRLIARVEAEPDITIPELAERLMESLRMRADPASLSRPLCRVGFTRKKQLTASECDRAGAAERRRHWITGRQPHMRRSPWRLVFLDETSITTRMARLRGPAPCGQRLKARVPAGRWRTQTFMAGLRSSRLAAPWITPGAINRQAFETYIETRIAPVPDKGDVVILGNLSAHLSAKAKAVGGICKLFEPEECWNNFKEAGDASDQRHVVLAVRRIQSIAKLRYA